MNSNRRLGVALAGSLLLSALGASAAQPAGPSIGVIVRGISAAAAADAIADAGGTVTFDLPIMNGAAGTIPATQLSMVRARADVIEVVMDAPITFQRHDEATESGSSMRSVYAREIRADDLWDQGVSGRGVRVALIDTGVADVPDLASRIASVPSPTDPNGSAACVDLSGEGTCNDGYGHGTFIAGLIAGTGASSNGQYRGVAPGAEIVSIKIAGRDGSSDVSKVLAAIQWVVSFRSRLNIRVLNLSLGTNSPFSYRHDPLNFAVEQAWRSGIAVVVAASNRGPAPGTISKPADDPLVITTGAVDDRGTTAIWDDRLPNFSGRGPTLGDNLSKPDLTAPGAHVISLRAPGSTIEQLAPGGGVDATYRRGSGTSMAAGIVSGSIALALEANPSWSPDRVKFALMDTAREVASSDPQAIGRGLINIYRATREAPAGVANTDVFVLSDGLGSLDQSRGDLKVSSVCGDPVERASFPSRCDVVQGAETVQARVFEATEYLNGDWTDTSWYKSQWAALLGTSWYGTSWYGTSWYGTSWYGTSWYGTSWYGYEENQTDYGTPVPGSAWLGAWD